MVSIHAPVKGRPGSGCDFLHLFSSFNPRPREGATHPCTHHPCVGRVSIHAPVKGRPPIALNSDGFPTVSIHAPVKGRRGAGMAQPPPHSFNPRPREGATRVLRDLQEMQEVSIHAPVKGRLYAAGKRRGLTEVSIHAPVKGRRRMLGACSMPWRFQSTPP